jgi:hypothetical protein
MVVSQTALTSYLGVPKERTASHGEGFPPSPSGVFAEVVITKDKKNRNR